MNNKVKFQRGTSDEYAVAEKDSDTIYFTTDDGKLYIGDKEVSGSDVTIDDTLSDTSTNPVQNKVIKAAIDNKADKTVATTSADGLMSASDKSKLDSADDTYALKSKYGDTTIDVGRKSGSAVGEYSTAEGYDTTASGNYSHAEGAHTTASGNYSHAEGAHTTASGHMSHAEGASTTASGNYSHAEGFMTTASGEYSHAGGRYTKALHMNEVAYGQFNESNDDTLFSVGDGTSDSARHNAFEITTAGGKLHDKDIATTDLIPTTLPANGGNADTAKQVKCLDIIGTADSCTYKTILDWANHYTYLGCSAWAFVLSAYGVPSDAPEQTEGIVRIESDDTGVRRLVTWNSYHTNVCNFFTRPIFNNIWNGDWHTVNADTVDGLHADDFVNANAPQIQIPSNVDLPAWIVANGKRYQQYFTNNENVGLTNVPNNSSDYVWYWFDGINILAREWVSGKYYVCGTVNGGFDGWKDVYTSGFKPYVTGTLSDQAISTPVTSAFDIFDFTPSKVICQFGSGNAFFANVVTNGFSVTIPAGTTTIHYIAFK